MPARARRCGWSRWKTTPRGCRRSFPAVSSSASRWRGRSVTDPQILLLDEPFSALDPFLRIRMRAELKRLQRELGISFIHVTHSQEEAMALADLIVVMNEGRIEQIGTPRDIYNKPRTEFVARFIGGNNVLPIDGRRYGMRADRLRLREGPAGLAATVREVEYQGIFVLVSLRAEDDLDLTAHRRGAELQRSTRSRSTSVSWCPGIPPTCMNWRRRANASAARSFCHVTRRNQ